MATHRFRTRAGTTLAARVRGEGPNVLQLSGGPGMVNYLPAPPDGFPARVVSPDPRGVGASEGGPHGVGQALKDLEGLRRTLDLDHWDLVVGHSSGADLGLAYAAEHPRSVAQLVSVCGTGVQDDRTWHDAYAAAEDTEPDLGIPYDEPVHRALLDDWRRWIREPDLYRKLFRIDQAPRFAVAEHDIRPSWPVLQLAALFDQRPQVVGGVAHDFWHTHPERWWELVAAALPEARTAEDGAAEQRELVVELNERLEVLDPLTRALDDGRGVVDLLLEAGDVEEARERLRSSYGFSELAATAVLDLQLRRLPRTQRDRIRQERDDCRARLRDVPGT